MVSVYVRETLIQLWTPDAVRGRVNAVNKVFIGASNELGEFRAGVMAALVGTVPAVMIGGLGTMAVAGLWAAGFRSCAAPAISTAGYRVAGAGRGTGKPAADVPGRGTPRPLVNRWKGCTRFPSEIRRGRTMSETGLSCREPSRPRPYCRLFAATSATPAHADLPRRQVCPEPICSGRPLPWQRVLLGKGGHRAEAIRLARAADSSGRAGDRVRAEQQLTDRSQQESRRGSRRLRPSSPKSEAPAVKAWVGERRVPSRGCIGVKTSTTESKVVLRSVGPNDIGHGPT